MHLGSMQLCAPLHAHHIARAHLTVGLLRAFESQVAQVPTTGPQRTGWSLCSARALFARSLLLLLKLSADNLLGIGAPATCPPPPALCEPIRPICALARAPTDPRAGVAGASDEIAAAKELAIGAGRCFGSGLARVPRDTKHRRQAPAARPPLRCALHPHRRTSRWRAGYVAAEAP